MTKTLKLLYILDETAFKRSGSPITWLDFKVWKDGPVAIEIYKEIKNGNKLNHNGEEISLDAFVFLIKKYNETRNKEEIYIKSNSAFNKNIFSQFEIDLIEEIEFKFGNWTSKQLIDYLHEEGSLWHKMVQENNLKKHFKEIGKRTNHSIDFHDLDLENSILKLASKAAYESLIFQENLG